MFFPRLRRQAKWMFVFLALVFGVGFVVFGVGSGQGTGLGDILQGGGTSSGGPSVGESREKIEKEPKNPAGYRELATALLTDGRQNEAIDAYERYLKLRPKDYEEMRTLAGLYSARANRFRNEYEAIRAEAEAQTGGGAFGPPQNTDFGRALGGRINQEFQAIYNERLTEVITNLTEAYSRTATLYSRIVAARPDDEAELQLQLADAAYQARRVPLAVRAYKRYVELQPEGQYAEYARQQIAGLQAGAANVPRG